MSKLQELINKLCPNGVEFKPLGEVFEMRNGYTPSKTTLIFGKVVQFLGSEWMILEKMAEFFPIQYSISPLLQ